MTAARAVRSPYGNDPTGDPLDPIGRIKKLADRDRKAMAAVPDDLIVRHFERRSEPGVRWLLDGQLVACLVRPARPRAAKPTVEDLEDEGRRRAIEAEARRRGLVDGLGRPR